MDYSQYNGQLIRIDHDAVYYVNNGQLEHITSLSTDPKKPTIIHGMPFVWNANSLGVPYVQEVSSGAKKPGLIKKVTNFVIGHSDTYKAVKKAAQETPANAWLGTAADAVKKELVDEAPKNLLKGLAAGAAVVGAGLGLSLLDQSKAKIVEAQKATVAESDAVAQQMKQAYQEASVATENQVPVFNDTPVPDTSVATVLNSVAPVVPVAPVVQAVQNNTSILDKAKQLLSDVGAQVATNASSTPVNNSDLYQQSSSRNLLAESISDDAGGMLGVILLGVLALFFFFKK